MNPIERIAKIFAETFEDGNLSRNEKKGLKKLLEESNLDQRKRDILRSKIFDIAERNGEQHGMRFTLEWVEDASRLIEQTGRRTGNSLNPEVYFSPGDECKSAIIREIEKAKKCVDICVFTISDNDIADVILRRHKRRFPIRIISDNDKMYDHGSDIQRLAEAGMQVRIDRTEHHMHHKFAVIDSKIALTGSYNWTRSAAKYNEENLVLTYQPQIVASFDRHFDVLWKKMVNV